MPEEAILLNADVVEVDSPDTICAHVGTGACWDCGDNDCHMRFCC